MAPVTSAANNALVRHDDFHRDIMTVCRDRTSYQLKLMAQPDQMGLPAGMMQKTVIKTLAVPDPVSVRIEGNPRTDDQVGFIGLMFDTICTGLENAEAALAQIRYIHDLPQDH